MNETELELNLLRARLEAQAEELRRAHATARETAHHLAEAQRIGHFGSWQWIPAEDRVVWSAEMFRIFGIAPEDFDGTTETAIKAFHPDDRAMVFQATERTLAERKPQEVECRVLWPDGTVRWVHSESEIAFNEDGSIAEISGTYQDITERKLMEQALRQSEQNFRDLADNLPDVVARFDRQFRHIYVNRQIEAFANSQVADYQGKTNRELGMPEDLSALWEEAIRQVFDTGQVRLMEFDVPGPRGIVAFESRLVPEFGPDGTVTMVLGINRDVTERKRAAQALEDREGQLRLILQTALDGFALLDLQGHFLTVNDAYCALAGYSRDELLYMEIADVEVLEAAEDTTRRINHMVNQGDDRFETRHHCKDGRIVDVEISVNYLDIAGGRLVCFCRDITERKRTEAALRKSEARFAGAFRNSPDSININRLSDGLYLEINKGFTDLTGYPAADVLGKTSLEIEIWGDPADRARLVAGLREHGEVSNLEAPFRTKDGSIKVGLMSASTIQVGDELCIVSVTRDITERKRMEDEQEITVQLLRILETESDQRGMLRRVLDLLHRWSGCDAVAVRLHAGDDYPYFETSGFPSAFVQSENALCSHDLQGQVLRDVTGNPVLECMCGNVLCGRFDPAQPFFTPHGSFWTNSTTRLLATTTEADRQARTRNRCNGEGFESVALIPLRAGGITYGLLQLNDYRAARFTLPRIQMIERLADSLAIGLAQYQAQSQREAALEALQAGNARLRMALVASNQGIFELDMATGVVTTSEDFLRLLGYEPGGLPMAGWLESMHPDDRPHVEQMYREAFAAGYEERGAQYRFKHRSGEWRWIFTRGRVVARDTAGRPLRFLGTHMDITERKRAEEALTVAQKTESLGVLAGGVAHDFNNLLVAMLGQASLAQALLPPESPARAPIEKAVDAAQRAADLTRQLLAYSGRGHFAMEPLRLNTLVEENQRLLEVAIPRHVRLHVEPADRLPLVQADAGQMQQVLMNLIINAAEAIGTRPGTVTIRTGVADLTPRDRDFWQATGDPLPAGRYVTLQVGDDGCGMDPATVARIFDPFFTTKFTGRGLGLAAVLGIVKGHRGGLRVESTPGLGTTFHLVLPALAPEARAPVDAVSTPPEAAPAPPPGALILLIEDEAPVREAVTDILAVAGIRVLAAAGGLSGLALYREHQAEVRLVLLDLSMPGMNGAETFHELRAIDPQVPIILSSGYDESDVMARFAGQNLTGFLQKPYRLSALISTVREQLTTD
jgi:PAS domain S-box-containing protein